MSVYQEVTDRIAAALEQGAIPWRTSRRVAIPINAVSEQEYSGINILLLWCAPHVQPAWLTSRQVGSLGGNVREGEQPTQIVYVRVPKTVENGETGILTPSLALYPVFNVEQCEGLPDWVYRPLPVARDSYIDVHEFIAHIDATIEHGVETPHYMPILDNIYLPLPSKFASIVDYYVSSLHEHAHWTGHSMRLNRDLTGKMGDATYAAEELVAELTTAFLCAHLGLAVSSRLPRYLGSWLSALKTDNRAIFTAARKATQAANYLRALSSFNGEVPSG